jgi:hypothetical protein
MFVRTAPLPRMCPMTSAPVIPATIHYVWLGEVPMPADMQATIANWRALMPEFTVIEWNESNLDMEAHPFMARMHREGRYAFASDYARLQVLYQHGGIYLDTDVHVKKSLAPFLQERCLWSFEFDSFLSTAIIGAAPGHPFIAELMALYDDRTEAVVNNDIITRHFLARFPEFHLNNQDQRVGDDIRVVPKEYFIIPSFDRTKSYAVHAARNHWKADGRRITAASIVRRVIGDVLFYKLVNVRMNWGSEYRALDRARSVNPSRS